MALILAAACMFSFCIVFAVADDTYEDDYYYAEDSYYEDINDMLGDIDLTESLLTSELSDYYYLAELIDGYFAEGGAPSGEAVIMQMMHYFEYNEDYSDYIAESDDEGWFVTYNVPAEVYEQLVFTEFTQSQAIVDSLRASSYYNADGGYYEFTTGGGFGDSIPSSLSMVNTERSDSNYIAYGALAETLYDEETWEEIPYIPADDDVEGVDYIYISSMWVDGEVSYDTINFDDVNLCSGYRAYKLADYVKAVFAVDELSLTATMSAFKDFRVSPFPPRILC